MNRIFVITSVSFYEYFFYKNASQNASTQHTQDDKNVSKVETVTAAATGIIDKKSNNHRNPVIL